MRKRDFIAIGVMIFVMVICLVIMFVPKNTGVTVNIIYDGKILKTMMINIDDTYDFSEGGQFNEVIVRNGSVSITDANCANHDCIEQGSITKAGQTIVCLPHKLVISITGSDEDIDAIVN